MLKENPKLNKLWKRIKIKSEIIPIVCFNKEDKKIEAFLKELLKVIENEKNL